MPSSPPTQQHPASWRAPRGVARLLCLLAAGALGGCQRVGVAPPAPPETFPACRTPSLDTSGWRLEHDSLGVTYRIPERFSPRPPGDLPYRAFRAADPPAGRIAVGFAPSREHYTTLLRIPSPGMHEMTECMAQSNGRQVLLQAWRTEGGIFRDGRRYDLFEVLALVPVEPTRTLFVTGGGGEPAFQEVLLAVARSVDVEAP